MQYASKATEQRQHEVVSQPGQTAAEQGSQTAARPVPHYAIPQDRTPLWSERDRPGRLTNATNPYKQNLDLAPKVTPTTRFSSPAKYVRGPEMLSASSALRSSWSQSPRQRASPRQQDLAPLSSSRVAPPAMLKQGELLAAVNDTLEALGLPRGSSPPLLSRGQRWLAAHGLSAGSPTDTAPLSEAQQHSASPATSSAHHLASSRQSEDASAQLITKASDALETDHAILVGGGPVGTGDQEVPVAVLQAKGDLRGATLQSFQTGALQASPSFHSVNDDADQAGDVGRVGDGLWSAAPVLNRASQGSTTVSAGANGHMREQASTAWSENIQYINAGPLSAFSGPLSASPLEASTTGFILLSPKYEIIEIIGEGAYGLVMKCRVVGTLTTVAIKEFKIEDLDEDAEALRACSFREVQVLKELQHPNVVTYLEDFMLGNKLFIVCEYIPHSLLQVLEGTADPLASQPSAGLVQQLPSAAGPVEETGTAQAQRGPFQQSLEEEDATALAQRGYSQGSPKGLPRRQVHHIMQQLMSALDYIHTRGIVYRDVKPENVLVDNEGTIKLCDFGFSRHMVPGDVLTDYVATRWYRAPELLLGAPYQQPGGQLTNPQYGCPVDIWAAGCLMAELTTGEALFPGSSDIDQLYLQLQLLGPLPASMAASFCCNPHNAHLLPLPAKPVSSLKAWLGSVVKNTELQLLTGMLCLDPQKRWTAQRCLQHCTKHFVYKI
ncbi:hypothetical protein WJX79_002060 [Trebouxia sp. C0005]